ncbi:MAG: SUMF1/EgtB/PvdO family nonheme iron enzyme [Fimbriiglobus sp.]
MPHVQALMESFGLALCEKARRALTGDLRFGDVLPEVAKASLDHAHRHLTTEDLRGSIGALAALTPAEYEDRLTRLLKHLDRVQSVPFASALRQYLTGWPAMVRQVLRRPSDPVGHTPPEGLQFYKPDDILLFLPARLPKLRSGYTDPKLEDWTLTEFQGIGECSEVWMGNSPSQPELSPAALKFITDRHAAAQLRDRQDLLVKVFELNEVRGVVPLRGVYLDSQLPCLDVGYVYGYDMTGLIHEWSWRYEAPRPDAATRIIRRVAEIVGEAHKRGIVHRDLKPSNILFHPREAGKFTVWVTDFGWGQIVALRSIELGHGGTPKGEQHRLELRGAYSPLYACPQLVNNEPPDPRDDIHALGVIWYQLLKRNPHLAAPVGTDWADDLRQHGFTDGHLKLLMSCVAVRPDRRPKDANDLLAKLDALRAPDAKPSSGGTLSGSAFEIMPVGKAYAQPARMPTVDRFTNSIGMTMVLVQPGKFLMGAPDDEPGWRQHEAPIRQVEITRPFYMSLTPVTQEQFEKVMGYNPSAFGPKAGGQPNWPVENVSWMDAVQFCEKLEAFAAEEDQGRVYRLPTEAEWEYACRAGEAMPYFFGQKLSIKQGCFNTGTKDAPKHPAPVGSYPANRFGLVDMHGNVLEWVHDNYFEFAYRDLAKTDPQGPDRGTQRVARGGCWMMYSTECRSAARRPYPPNHTANHLGFRIVMQV